MTPLEVLAIETLDRPLSLRILESLKQHGYSLNKATSDVTTTTTDKFNKAITEHNIYNACLYSENGGVYLKVKMEGVYLKVKMEGVNLVTGCGDCTRWTVAEIKGDN